MARYPRRREGGRGFPGFFEDILDDFMTPFSNLTELGFKTDIRETDEDYIVEAELPGMDKDDINVELQDDCLVISAERTEEEEVENEDYIRRERRGGRYQRRFQLDNVKEEEIEAEYDNGVLTVTLPKEEPGKGRRRTIDIN